MTSAVAGWQLYAMARNMFDSLPNYTEDQKKAYFGKIASIAISEDGGQMIPFKPSDTIEVLNNIVMPFWLSKMAAEREVDAYRKRADAAAASKDTGPDSPEKPAVADLPV